MIKTPFSDACGYGSVPTTGANSSSTEPGLPAGMPGRTGGLLPEKLRDTAVSPKMPGFSAPDKTDLKG
jgi:hypothetical protein